MKHKLTLLTALLLAAAIALSLAACGKTEEPAAAGITDAVTTTEATEPSTEFEDTTTEAPEDETTTEPESETTGDEITTEAVTTEAATTEPGAATTTAAPTTAKPTDKAPGTPAEVLAAYTEVMNKAKKDAKSFRKLEYQFLDKDAMNFELDVINQPGFLDWLNDNLMTTKEKGLTQEQYTKGVTDMTVHLPVMNTPVGCMVKDPGVFTKATAKKLSNGNVELTLVMKPEDNPEPATHGATTSPSVTGQMFNPLSKAGIDDLLRKARIFITTKLDFNIRYFDCKSVLVYNPDTMQVVSLRQDYYVLINVASGRVLFINAKGTGVLEAATVCDQFVY